MSRTRLIYVYVHILARTCVCISRLSRRSRFLARAYVPTCSCVARVRALDSHRRGPKSVRVAYVRTHARLVERYVSSDRTTTVAREPEQASPNASPFFFFSFLPFLFLSSLPFSSSFFSRSQRQPNSKGEEGSRRLFLRPVDRYPICFHHHLTISRFEKSSTTHAEKRTARTSHVLASTFEGPVARINQSCPLIDNEI